MHILAKMVEALEYKNCEKEAREFLQWLLQQNYDQPSISNQAFSFAFMYLLKSNELAREFYDKQGFELLGRFLEKHCVREF